MRSLLVLAVAVLGLAASGDASAEIYRWTDDQGREHFTMDLHSVPAQYRAQAERRQALDKAKVDPGPAPINTMTTQDGSRVKRALRPRYSSSRSRGYGAAPASASDGCASWMRSKGLNLQRRIADYEKKVELYEEQERRLVRTKDRLRAENNVERYEIYLEKAEEEYDTFLDDMRRRGVEPGCFR